MTYTYYKVGDHVSSAPKVCRKINDTMNHHFFLGESDGTYRCECEGATLEIRYRAGYVVSQIYSSNGDGPFTVSPKP